MVDVLESIFIAGYEISGSYGLSVIILGVVVNTILWPVYHVVDRMKSGQKSKFHGMLAEIDEIKACYHGRERYYYTKAIQRRYGYSFRHKAILFVGLLIEVLFFVAAYEMLTAFTGFRGTPFLFLSDLGLPDALYTAGNLSVNVLPIVMTLLNLLSSSIYTRTGQSSERKQLWFLAVAFLIVLYEAPAALTLYWIVNNSFALAKQVIPAIFACDRSALVWITSTVTQIRERLSTATVATMGFGAVCYLFLAAHHYQQTLHSPATSFYIAIASLTLLFALFSGNGVLTVGRCRSRTIRAALLAGTAGLLLVLTYLLGSTLLSWPATDIAKAALVLACTVPTVFFAIAVRGRNTIEKNRRQHSGQMLPIFLAVGYIGSSTFLWIPLAVYASSPGEFAFSPNTLLMHNIPLFICTLVLFSLPVVFFRKFRDIAFAISPLLACCFFVYAYVLPISFGSLEGFVLDSPAPFDHSLGVYLAECLVLLFLVTLFVKRPRGPILLAFLLIINVAAAGEGLYHLLGGQSTKMPSASEEMSLSSVKKEVFNLSRTGKNVVIIVLDGFNTSYIRHIFEEQSHLKEEFAGFVYYPNTITSSYYTSSAMPVIVGGWDYTPNRMNALEGDTLALKSNRVYEKTIAALLQRQYAPAFIEPVAYRVGTYDGLASIAAKAPTVTAMEMGNHWETQNGRNEDSGHSAQQINMLTAVALFRSVPLAVKPLIYRNGKWFNPAPSAYLHARNHYAVLDLLPRLSTAEGGHNTFKVIYSAITHRPYAVTKNGKLMKSGIPDPTADTSYGGLNAYYSARWSFGALARYFKWLRQTGIYDNTRIIVVSDHGNNYSLENSVAFSGKELLPALELTEKEANRIGALLMVKDYNATRQFAQSGALMSNGDVRDIALGESPLLDKYESRKPVLKHYRTLNWRTADMYHNRTYKYDRIYQIDGDYYDLTKWTLVKRSTTRKDQ
ncbi:MAG: YidC/Oxa1 family membrane protein insertase [Sedimenticola sp.]